VADRQGPRHVIPEATARVPTHITVLTQAVERPI